MMIRLQSALLLLLVTGWTVDEGESKVRTTSSVQVSSVTHADPPRLVPELVLGSSEEEEEEEHELSGSEELEDGMATPQVQAVVKPQSKSQKKKGSKNQKRRKSTSGKKRRDPCKTTYKDYCIHGKCQYLKELGKPSCVCLPGYQNERCGIQALHTGTNKEQFDSLSVTLIAVGVTLLVFALTAVTVALTLYMRKKMRIENETENEDKLKLRAENGIVV
ncbi:proheparin-binding EGF-like growth factor [Narcine bancroftii]|uniref:proheparin-binding EGF-like growth factor n=1 Tax=Narcine bancroftii TaxID=1343680 RepID=UPI003831A8EC